MKTKKLWEMVGILLKIHKNQSNLNKILFLEASMSPFAVIYRIYLQPDKEKQYLENWQIVASYFIEKCGAIGSTLHQADDGMWVAYSLWPDRATRDAAWPKEGSPPNATFPQEIKRAIANLKECSDPLRLLPEITMKTVQSIKKARG